MLHFYSFPLTTGFFPLRCPSLSDPTKGPCLDPIASLASLQPISSFSHLSSLYTVSTYPSSSSPNHCTGLFPRHATEQGPRSTCESSPQCPASFGSLSALLSFLVQVITASNPTLSFLGSETSCVPFQFLCFSLLHEFLFYYF